MNDFFAYWGCGNGLLKSVQPHIRIIAGVQVGCACLLVPLPSSAGVMVLLIATTCWSMGASMPKRMLLRCVITSIVLFAPFLLLTPWIATGPFSTTPVPVRFAHAGAIALRSTCTLFITASTIALLTLPDLHRGLAGIPLPRTVIALVIQLINQTMYLAEETARILGVLRLRGTSGIRGFRVIFSFPIVWMVRMLFRAERTAAAMTVRGYGIETATAGGHLRLAISDVLTMVCSSVFFVLAILLRLRGIP
jgi:hypothetical protein